MYFAKELQKKKTTLTFITINKNTDIGTTLIIKSVLSPVTIILIYFLTYLFLIIRIFSKPLNDPLLPQFIRHIV